jgi:hypothetical protein
VKIDLHPLPSCTTPLDTSGVSIKISSALKMPTFAVKGFPYLRAVLLAQGWTEDLQQPDFAYTWDGIGAYHRIPGTGYIGAGGKQHFFRILARQHFTKYLPITYERLADVPQVDQTYFVKGNYGCYSKQIAVFHTYTDLQAKVPKLAFAGSCVIQPAIARPLLHQGYKQSFRIYVLTLRSGEVYVYKRMFSALGGKPFTSNSQELEAHVPAINAPRIEVTNPQLRWTIMRAAADIGHAYSKEVPYGTAGYALYGVDVLVDEDGKPWVIENNVSCDLVPSTNPGPRNDIITNMAQDLYGLLIAPQVLGVKPQLGLFTQVM